MNPHHHVLCLPYAWKLKITTIFHFHDYGKAGYSFILSLLFVPLRCASQNSGTAGGILQETQLQTNHWRWSKELLFCRDFEMEVLIWVSNILARKNNSKNPWARNFWKTNPVVPFEMSILQGHPSISFNFRWGYGHPWQEKRPLQLLCQRPPLTQGLDL